MDETAAAGESLTAKVAGFMAGLTEEELALFVATLPVANPPEAAQWSEGEGEGEDTAGYNLAVLTSFAAPTPVRMPTLTFRCRPKVVGYADDWSQAPIIRIVCGWE